ncbi:MAG TPA: hypothetical protein VF765_36545 [Polyangiaceae bacterium]
MIGEGIVLLLVAVIAGLTARQTLFSERARTRRLLRSLKRSPIGSISEGPVKIAGKLRLAGRSLRAPLSGRTCAVYDVEVIERRQVDQVILQDRLACDFLVDDGTGTALVRVGDGRGGQLELAIVHDAKYASGLLKDATAELERYLSTFGEKSTATFANRYLRYREGAFEPGEHIVVCGLARREPDPEGAAERASYRDAPTRLVIEALAGKIHLSDEPDVAGSASSAPGDASRPSGNAS